MLIKYCKQQWTGQGFVVVFALITIITIFASYQQTTLIRVTSFLKNFIKCFAGIKSLLLICHDAVQAHSVVRVYSNTTVVYNVLLELIISKLGRSLLGIT